jgi:hypothetical protein
MIAQLKTTRDDIPWVEIARYFPSRTSRQCRERWINYLNPNANCAEMTQMEEDRLIHLYRAVGPKWASFRPYFPHRTDVFLKNRCNCILRRQAKTSNPRDPPAPTVATVAPAPVINEMNPGEFGEEFIPVDPNLDTSDDPCWPLESL